MAVQLIILIFFFDVGCFDSGRTRSEDSWACKILVFVDLCLACLCCGVYKPSNQQQIYILLLTFCGFGFCVCWCLCMMWGFFHVCGKFWIGTISAALVLQFCYQGIVMDEWGGLFLGIVSPATLCATRSRKWTRATAKTDPPAFSSLPLVLSPPWSPLQPR